MEVHLDLSDDEPQFGRLFQMLRDNGAHLAPPAVSIEHLNAFSRGPVGKLFEALGVPPVCGQGASPSSVPHHKGQLVDMSRWNAVAVPGDRYESPCVVRSCLPAKSESGWMVEVAEIKPTDRPGCPVTRCLVLDSGWLTTYFTGAGKTETSND